MYGIIFVTLGSIIQAEFGNDMWFAILDKVGYRNTAFCTHSVYPENLVINMANAAVLLVSDGSTVNDFLTYFGRCFIRAARNFGYETMIRSCGRFFCDFISGIDNIHLHMRYRYPKMIHPFIYILEEDKDGVLINYRTTRKDNLCPFLYGILDQVATDVFGIRLSLQGKLPDAPQESNEEGYQYRIRLNFDNRDYMAVKACKSITQGAIALERKIMSTACSSTDCCDSLSQLSSGILLQLFPFSLVFRSDMKTISAGNQLKRMYSNRAFLGTPLPEVARLRRPRVNFSWENLITFERLACELEMVPMPQRPIQYAYLSKRNELSEKSTNVPYDDDDLFRSLHHSTKETRRLLLRGQMRYIEDWKAIIFLCNPLINNIDDLRELGLALSDLSLHGHGRSLVMNGLQHNSRLEDLYERAEGRAIELKMTHELLDEWKQRGADLLYSMIPQSIAETLRSGKEPVDTCKTFESVTVSFVEMTNIDGIMAQSAMEAVNCMNAVFSCLDKVIDQHNVYKVETVGNVYMVVGGAPETNETHAKDVSIVCLGFHNEIEHLSSRSSMLIEIRIGVHTGSAVAGVVGWKMPRYCFFGDTINTAARMQTTSLPGKIHMSHASYNLLQFGQFVFEKRGSVTIKGKGEMETYWLLKFDDSLRQKV